MKPSEIIRGKALYKESQWGENPIPNPIPNIYFFVQAITEYLDEQAESTKK